MAGAVLVTGGRSRTADCAAPGGPDVLVNQAGIFPHTTFLDTAGAEWERFWRPAWREAPLVPRPRVRHGEDVAALAVHLAPHAGVGITGQAHHADGGAYVP